MTDIIIQARLGSTRLPNKIFMPFSDGCVLDFLIKRLKLCKKSDSIIIATTDNKSDDKIKEYCDKNDLKCFRGPEEDVLERFILTARFYKVATIIRVCSDNPFVVAEYVDSLIIMHDSFKCDYCSYQTRNGTPSILTHYGFFAELVTLDALHKIKEAGDSGKPDHEHVTKYIYTHPDKFLLKFIAIANKIEKHTIRLTLDTINDYNNLLEIVESVDYMASPYKIINLIYGKNDLLKRMQLEIDANKKS